LTGLAHSTTYYYKAYATNAIGTNYGEVKQFTTSSPSMPTVQTNNASSITSSGATLNGNVTADGGATVTVRGFVYGTSASDLSQNVQSGSGTGNFTKALTGLTRSTTYCYKAYATNSAGTAYGEVKTFTTISDGKIDALYSVSSTSKVYFSKGNLSYQSGTWSFVESQLEYGSYFCYGTGNNPVITSYSYYDYPTFTDWGTNPISNGGNIPNQWRTLSKDEWDYLLFTRTTTSNIRYAMAIVNGVAGVILLPDNWNSSYYPLNSTNTTNAAFSVNTISPLGWLLIEASGAVFLPAAGENYYGMLHVGEWGHYWSQTGYNGIEGAYILRFYNNNLAIIQSSRGRGESVRLVMDE
ncbi:MAG: hypothetical protein II815_01285, partial [Bacteroidales bacterium]|nr:hypothetical protein [Bacteroidales bacterium]